MSQVSGKFRSGSEKTINMHLNFQQEARRVIRVNKARLYLWLHGGPPTRKTIEEAIERSRLQRERANKGDADFITRWNFLISLFSDCQTAEDTINHLEERYKRDLKRYGVTGARLLYRKEAVRSLSPLLKWALHRTVVIGLVKHYLPAIDSILRLFRLN